MKCVALALNLESGRAICTRAHVILESAQSGKDRLVAAANGDLDLAAAVVSFNERCVEL